MTNPTYDAILFKSNFFKDLRLVPKNISAAVSENIEKIRTSQQELENSGKLIELRVNRWQLELPDDYVLLFDRSKSNNQFIITLLLVDIKTRAYWRLSPENNKSINSRDIALDIDRISGISTTLLKQVGIPERLHKQILSIKSWQDVSSLIPELQENQFRDLCQILNPKNQNAILQQPTRVLVQPNSSTGVKGQINRIAQGKSSIESYLVEGDIDQANAIDILKPDIGNTLTFGHRLIRGGPGTGKTLIGLYGAIQLLLNPTMTTFGNNKILFTTYTNSLTHVAQTIINELSKGTISSDRMHDIEIKTVDSAIGGLVKHITVQRNWTDQLLQVIHDYSKTNQSTYGGDDLEFLVGEFEGVIESLGLTDKDTYLKLSRRGLGQRISTGNKEQIWDLYEGLTKKLSEMGKVTLGRMRMEALNEPRDIKTYRAVFIDEAQDLSKVQLSVLRRLAEDNGQDTQNIVVLADENQSIYNPQLSWFQKFEGLNFQGRSTVLKTNHRNTKQIWNAIKNFNADITKDMAEMKAVRDGPKPTLHLVSNFEEIGPTINEFLGKALVSEGVSSNSAAVLCPSHTMCEIVTQLIDPKYQPRHFYPKEFDVAVPGVKVITIHTAKGTEFPIVAAVGVGLNDLSKIAVSDDWDDDFPHDSEDRRTRRIRYVALSRAGQHLSVFARDSDLNEFMSNTSDDDWEIP